MRRSLALVALAVTSMVALAFLIPLAMVVSETARDRAVSDAQRQAGALAPVLAVTTERTAVQRALASTEAGTSGRLAVHLPGAGVVGVPRADPTDVSTAGRRGRSFEVEVHDGYALLQPVTLDRGRTAVIEVFVPEADLTRGVHSAWGVMVAVAALLVAGSLLVADRLGARVVGSARRLAAAAGALGGGDLTVRVEPSGPAELQEAGTAFNTMADRVVQLLAGEREMAADLSHRLRTPLAALRLNVGALPSGPATEQTRIAVDRLEREIDTIIRTERRADGTAGCDVAEVVRERVGFWSALAEDQGRACTLRGVEAPVRVPVVRGELAAVLDALLGNVFRHTEEGTSFGVTVRTVRGLVGLIVLDAGPGIDDPRAAARRGSSGGGSTGLGLDIARRVAESTGGELRIDTPPQGGTQIEMWLRTSESTEPGWPPRHRRRATGWWRRDRTSRPSH